MNYLIKIITVVTILLAPLFANVGNITALKGDVKIQNSSVDIAATLGATLNAKDHVITADKSKAQLIFKDDTIVTVGKNSNFSIASYIYDVKNEPKVEFELIRGAMRTITGKIGKIAPEKFKVKTKNATIGIRGTNFTVVSGDEGSLQVYCTYGAIRVTFNKKVYMVKQGYYVHVNKAGKAKVKTFSASELNKINDDSFGKEEVLSDTSNEDGSSTYTEVGLDVTVEEVSEEVKQTVAQSTQDATQIASSTESYVSLTGHSIDNDAATSLKSLSNLRFTSDGSLFDSEKSWVEVQQKDNGFGGQDDWKFYLASTPTTFTSKDNFQITFSSVSLTPGTGSSSKNAVLTSGTFSATSDSPKEDYMSWGSWNAKVSFDAGSISSGTASTYDAEGLWVTGEATSTTVVDAITGSTQSYSGKYQALNFTSATVPETGTAIMSVDFGTNRSAQLSLTRTGDNTPFANYNLSISGNTLSTSSTSSTEIANGTFYGPNAESIGGNFSHGTTSGSQTNVTLKGVYEVSKIVK